MQKETDKVEEFLDNIKSYIDTKTTTTRGTTVLLKRSAFTDPDKLREIWAEAKKIGAVPITAPPGFIIPLVTANKENGATLIYLHESQIEDGGPQPRIEIRPDDPETISLFTSIKQKGQLAPISIFPSPTTQGKYRIYEGHRRRMVIFNMLRLDGILAVVNKISEQEAFEHAFTLNYERKSLSAYELGAYLMKLQVKYPNAYPNQETLGRKVGLSQETISRILASYKELESQKEKIPAEVMPCVIKLPQRTIEHISRAPEDTKAALYQQATDKKLSVAKTKALVTEVSAVPNADASTVEEKAEALFAETDQIQRKSDKLLDTLLNECRIKLPEAFVKDLYGRTVDGKITVEKANNFASAFFAIAYEMLRKEGKLDFVFAEAAKW